MNIAQFKIGQIVNVGGLQCARVLAKAAYPAEFGSAWIVECDGLLYEVTDRRIMKISQQTAIELGKTSSAYRRLQDEKKAFKAVFGGQFDALFA